MDMNAINSVTSTFNSYQTSQASKKVSETADKTTTTDKTETGVVYEKSSQTDKNTVTKKTDYKMVEKLKADAKQRTSQLRSLVEKMMTKQGTAIANADSMWSFLAEGNFTVDEETQKQAQADIAEDGYWGVEQTSDRILDFAKALSEKLDGISDGCVVCDKINHTMERYADVLLYMWANDEKFKEKFDKSKGVCLKHMKLLVDTVPKSLKDSQAAQFLACLFEKQEAELSRIQEDIHKFTLKFDYRNKDME